MRRERELRNVFIENEEISIESLLILKEISDTLRNRKDFKIRDLIEYLYEYSEKNKKDGYNWDINICILIYKEYVEVFKKLGKSFLLYPKKDIFYMVDDVSRIQKNAYKQICVE